MFTFTHGANVNVQKHRLGEQDEYDHLKTDSNVTSKMKLIPTTCIHRYQFQKVGSSFMNC